jgi:hypothetical protein
MEPSRRSTRPPHAIYSYPTSINPAGEITGYFINANESGLHGFVRAADGTITTFDAGPDRTYSVSINPRGTVMGLRSCGSRAARFRALLRRRNHYI